MNVELILLITKLLNYIETIIYFINWTALFKHKTITNEVFNFY